MAKIDLTNLSDAELVSACQQGDQAAWNELVQRYQALVYTIPRRYGLTDSEVQDVFQSVWLLLVKHLHNLSQPDRVAAWLVTTAKRETWDRRRGASYERVELMEPALFSEMPLTDSKRPDDLLIQYEQQKQVRDALQRLDERCRILLILLYYEHPRPSYHEISERLELAIGSIGPIRARCLKKLSKQMEDVI